MFFLSFFCCTLAVGSCSAAFRHSVYVKRHKFIDLENGHGWGSFRIYSHWLWVFCYYFYPSSLLDLSFTLLLSICSLSISHVKIPAVQFRCVFCLLSNIYFWSMNKPQYTKSLTIFSEWISNWCVPEWKCPPKIHPIFV